MPTDVRPVQYDASVYEARLGAHFDALLLALGHPAWREAVGDAWLSRLNTDIAAVRARMRQPFCLLVVGDFKRGKSTLINAIVGQRLVTMDVAPETVTLTELHHGPTLRIEARLVDGGRVTLRPEDLPGERLSAVLANLPAAVDVVRIEAPVPLLEGVTVVDSPGTGDLLWRFDRRVQDYLPRADAVLYVVSALSPLSETERGFLHLSLRPLELSKLAFVVNLLDTMPTEADAARVVARVTERIHTTFPDSPVFGVSALHTLSRQEGEPPPAPARADALDAAFAALRAHLDERVLLHRDAVRSERAVHDAEVALDRAADALTRLQDALALDRAALQVALAAAQDEGSAARLGIAEREARLRAEIATLGEEAVGWMTGLVARVEEEVMPALAALPHETAQRHFPFFLSEALRDGLAACVDAHQDRLFALVEALSTEAAAQLGSVGDFGGAVAVEHASARATFHTPAWTVFEHLHVVGFLLGMMTGIVAPLLAGLADRGLAQKVRAEGYRDRLRAAMPELETQVTAAVRRAYAEIAVAMAARVRTTQTEELDRLASALTQALAVHDRGESRIVATGETLGQVAARIAETRRALEQMRSGLRAAAE